MMKHFTLLLFIGLIFNGWDHSNINYIVHNLPNSFPIDRDYKWEYKKTEYVNKTDWENEWNPDTTYFGTLHAGPSENHQYFYYGWKILFLFYDSEKWWKCKSFYFNWKLYWMARLHHHVRKTLSCVKLFFYFWHNWIF